jgi:uncharacterized protein (TIGR02145 family)
MLDVQSTTKGMLLPRMTMAELEAIPNPATGLLVFCNDDDNFFVNRGVPATPDWTMVNSKWRANGLNIYFPGNNVGIGWQFPIAKLDIRGINPDEPVNFLLGASDLSHRLLFSGGRTSDPNPFILWKQGDDLRFMTDESGGSERMRITNSGQVGIGTPLPNNSALMEMTSTSQGFLPPRMTESQRTGITTPAAGLLVFQTDVPAGYYYYTGSNWVGITGAGPGAISASTCIDYDGNAYPTFQIGTQVWMAENLRVTHYRNGNTIPNVTNNTAWAALTTGAYCWYNNDQSTNAKYGILYNWYAVNDSRNICPTGWHMPSDAEWTTLTTYLGGESVAGGKMKSVSALWASPNTNATNNSGFSGLPGGYRYLDGLFLGIGSVGYWWTATEGSTNYAWSRILNYSYSDVSRGIVDEAAGVSVRCVRD